MRAVIQRVSSASVTIDQAIKAKIGRGLVVLLGIQSGDTSADVEWLAAKTANLRIFADREEKMNLSLLDLHRTTAEECSEPTRSNVLVVSQFTLIASTRKGNRPSFNDAAKPGEAIPLYEAFLAQMERLLDQPIPCGTFGAMMEVELVNDGPVTIILDSKTRE
jgi:D-tyrosyl-tRNA(Tyr) deacylase